MGPMMGNRVVRLFVPSLSGPYASPAENGRPVTIGLLNNMPDAALVETERQFENLLTRGGRDRGVEVRPFALEGLPRSERARRYLAEHYGSLDDLKICRLDALVITGTEPRAARFPDEPYWNALTEVFDWAEAHTLSTFVSCLAAHAAVLHFEGIERRPLRLKCCGIFDHEVAAEHPLMRGVGAPWQVAHSRWNELVEARLRAAGYAILSRSEEAGVNLFVRPGRSLFVMAQGHPEYGPDALPREYRRDVRRFLSREREDYPAIPRFCFDAAVEASLDRFRERAQALRSVALMEEFPALAPRGPDRRGRALAASRLFENWVGLVRAERALWKGMDERRAR